MGTDAGSVTAVLAFALISVVQPASGEVSSALIATPSTPDQQILVHPSDNLSAVVAHASPGDVLLLADGVYQPGVVVAIDKNLTIAAQTDGRAVIDGQSKHRVFYTSSYGVVHLKGLNITAGSEHVASGGGVLVDGMSTVILDTCHIYGNFAAYGGGVASTDRGSLHVAHSRIYSNQGEFGGGGVNLNTYGTTHFTHTDIYSNEASAFDGGGVSVQCAKGGVTFDACSITSNRASTRGGGIYLDAATRPKLHKSEVTNNKPDNCYGFKC